MKNNVACIEYQRQKADGFELPKARWLRIRLAIVAQPMQIVSSELMENLSVMVGLFLAFEKWMITRAGLCEVCNAGAYRRNLDPALILTAAPYCRGRKMRGWKYFSLGMSDTRGKKAMTVRDFTVIPLTLSRSDILRDDL